MPLLQEREPPRPTGQRRYELMAPIGFGGFGTVYRARLVGPGGFEKQVAIKILNREAADDPELASRLRDEVQMLGLVRNQAIVQVDGLLQVAGRWAVVMEYVEGLDLFVILRQLPMPPRPALEMVGHLATALEIAWKAETPAGVPIRLIHRDIKPSNIKISTAGEVKILDFGIARAEFGAREAKTNMMSFGTPQYMAPERRAYQDGPAGDIYALGVVLFECLTRRQLYEKSCFTREERHQDRVYQAQEMAWEATKCVSEGLISFLGELLAFHPEARPDAAEVSRRCEALLDELKGPMLRSWARATLPPIVGTLNDLPPDGLTGVILLESTAHVSQNADAGPWPSSLQPVYPVPDPSPLPDRPVIRDFPREQPVTQRDERPQPRPKPPLPRPAPRAGERLDPRLIWMAVLMGALAFAMPVGVGMALVVRAVLQRSEQVSAPVTPPVEAPAPATTVEPAPTPPAVELPPTDGLPQESDKDAQAEVPPMPAAPAEAPKPATTVAKTPSKTKPPAPKPPTEAPAPVVATPPEPTTVAAPAATAQARTLLVLDAPLGWYATVEVGGMDQALPTSLPSTGRFEVLVFGADGERKGKVKVSPAEGKRITVTCNNRRCSAS